MFYQRVQKANSETPLRQQNNRLFPRPSDNFKPLPAPTTPDGRIDLSRLPTSDWMKNDQVLLRWAREEAAANSSDTPSIAPATDVAPPTPHDNETVNPELENLQVNSQTGVSPLPDGLQTQREPRFQPILSRLPTSDWMKNDQVLLRWAREEAAANSSKTPEIPLSIQAKLTVSTPGDKYELEADATAAKVMAMPDSALQQNDRSTPESHPTAPSVQRASQDDRTVTPELENRIQNATGGSPLPESVQSFMEPRFGVDFSQIRVHTDSNAAQMCKEVGAKAFAVGNRVYYGAGYAPGNNELTAHELTHTIQQGAAKRFNKQVRQLPEPQEMLVAKEIDIAPPYNNRQMRRFPTEEVAPLMQKVEPGFNRISRSIALEEIPESSLPAKQFTSNTEANFNKIQPVKSDKLLPAQLLEAKPLVLQKQEGDRALSVNQTNSQIQRNPVKDFIVQQLKNLMGRLGPMAERVIGILQNAQGIVSILSNPNKRQAFFNNLVEAIKIGFQNFSNKFNDYLKQGFVAWLSETLAAEKITMPPSFDTWGFVSIALQVLGINYQRVRQSLINALGSKAKVERLERDFDLVKNLATNASGLVSAIHTLMQKDIGKLKEEVTKSISDWLFQWVVQKAVQKLVTSIAPLGAALNALEGIYKTISFFIEKGKQMQFVLDAIQKSLNDIAGGKVGAAAAYIEQTLARSLSLTISLLAKIVGVESVGQRVRDRIKVVQTRVQEVMDNLVKDLVKKSKDFLDKRPTSQRAAPVNRPAGQPSTQKNQQIGNFTVKHPFTMSGKQHHLIGVFNNGSLNTLIASNPEDFEAALRRAINEVKLSSLSDSEKKGVGRILENTLGEIQELEFEVNMKKGEIIKGSPKEGGEEQAIRQYILRRLAQLANSLQSIAQQFKIQSLDDFYKEPPERRYLPGYPDKSKVREVIREKLYERLGWDRVQKSIVNKEKPILIARVRAAQQTGNQQKWRALIVEGIVEKSASINSYDPSQIKYSVDHIIPLAAHWNQTGYNSDDAERYDGLARESNLKLVTVEYNSSKSSTTGNSGTRVNYNPYVGPDFTSQWAQGGIKGALMIDIGNSVSKPFLDASSKPLT